MGPHLGLHGEQSQSERHQRRGPDRPHDRLSVKEPAEGNIKEVSGGQQGAETSVWVTFCLYGKRVLLC